MGEPTEPAFEENVITQLDGEGYDVVLKWLEKALRGQETLPVVVPDETPDQPILRWERKLSKMTREDLREAALTLVKRFVKNPGEEGDNSGYVAALLRLAKGFGLEEITTDLHRLASNKDAFATLPEPQVKAVLYALLDLNAPVPPEFWTQLAETLPDHLGVIVVSALLEQEGGYRTVAQVLKRLPDEEAVADSLYVALDQHALSQAANEAAKARVVETIQSAAPDYHAEIRKAVEEWAEEHAVPRERETQEFATKKSIDPTPLLAFFDKDAAERGEVFVRKRMSAKLVSQHIEAEAA